MGLSGFSPRHLTTIIPEIQLRVLSRKPSSTPLTVCPGLLWFPPLTRTPLLAFQSGVRRCIPSSASQGALS